MLHRRSLATFMAVVALSLLGAGGAAAQATPDPLPSFSRCPLGTANLIACVVVQSTAGSMTIRSTTVPINDSIRIEGGLTIDSAGNSVFVPPASGSPLTAKPITVPGGLLGIPLPLGLDTVQATTKLVGPVKLDVVGQVLEMPVIIELDNPLLGPNCQIGASWLPIKLKLITGTTAPPAPNTPISGHPGEFITVDGDHYEIKGGVYVDNAFSVPVALNCGYLGGLLINTLVDVKLGLPSPAGRNSATVTSNVFLANA